MKLRVSHNGRENYNGCSGLRWCLRVPTQVAVLDLGDKINRRWPVCDKHAHAANFSHLRARSIKFEPITEDDAREHRLLVE